MLRCNRCGQYYVPGFLDCQCRAMRCKSGTVDAKQYASNSLNTPSPLKGNQPFPGVSPIHTTLQPPGNQRIQLKAQPNG